MTTDLKQQVREAVRKLRRIQAWDVLEIADDLEAVAAAEPEYEVRWTYGVGRVNHLTKGQATRVAEYDGCEERTVRRVFVEPIQPKPEPELSVEEAARAKLKQKVLGTLNDFADMGPEDGEQWESWYRAAFDLAADKVCREFDAALARERGA